MTRAMTLGSSASNIKRSWPGPSPAKKASAKAPPHNPGIDGKIHIILLPRKLVVCGQKSENVISVSPKKG